MRFLCVLLLMGCTYREAMQRGHDATQQRDWPAAVAAYEAALEADPEDERARVALADALRQWHTQAIARFDAALAAGELGLATAALQEAERAGPEDPGTASARARLTKAQQAREAAGVGADAEKASQSGDIRGAFRLAARADALHSTPESQDRLSAARARLVEQARLDEAAGRLRVALGLYEALASVEPAQEAALQAFRGRFADHERAQGEAAAADGGRAFIHFAQAAALAGRPEDGARRDALRREILREYAPIVELRVEAPVERVSRLRAALDGQPGPPPDPGSPRLFVQFTARPAACDQTRASRVAEGQYVAGTRDVPNPEWQHLRAEIERERADVRRAEDDERRARETLRQVEERWERDMRDRRERFRREREAADRELDRARDQERRAFEAFRRAQDQRDEGAMRRSEGDLDQARRQVERAFELLERARASARDLNDDERDRARDQLVRAEEERRRRQDRLHDIERRLDHVPPTREEPRYATHRYAVHRWERACEGSAQVALRIGDLALDRVLTARAATADESHEVQVPLGLDEDPLRFPEDDTRLVARVDAQLGAEVANLAEQQRKAWSVALGDRALAAGDGPEATRLAVASILLDREGVRPAIKHRLAERFGLLDFGVLWAEGP